MNTVLYNNSLVTVREGIVHQLKIKTQIRRNGAVLQKNKGMYLFPFSKETQGKLIK